MRNVRPQDVTNVTSSPLVHIATAAIVWVSAADLLLADDLPASRHGVTICTSEAGGPWALRAHGTLSRTQSKNGEIYTLDVRDQTFTWSLTNNSDAGKPYPGFLISAFPPLRFPRGPISVVEDRGPRGQSFDVSGEIFEHVGSTFLSLKIGAACPSEKPKELWPSKLWPNPTVERDARKSGARPSP